MILQLYSKFPVFVFFAAMMALLVGFNKPNRAHAIGVNKGAIPQLLIKDKTGNIITTGTGFIVKPEGVLITAYHLLVDAAFVEAVFPDGLRTQVKGVYQVNRTKDFAILQLEGNFFSTLAVGNSSQLSPFDSVSAFGFPFTGDDIPPNQSPATVRQTSEFEWLFPGPVESGHSGSR